MEYLEIWSNFEKARECFRSKAAEFIGEEIPVLLGEMLLILITKKETINAMLDQILELAKTLDQKYSGQGTTERLPTEIEDEIQDMVLTQNRLLLHLEKIQQFLNDFDDCNWERLPAQIQRHLFHLDKRLLNPNLSKEQVTFLRREFFLYLYILQKLTSAKSESERLDSYRENQLYGIPTIFLS